MNDLIEPKSRHFTADVYEVQCHNNLNFREAHKVGIIGLIILLVIGIFIFASLKNSFDSPQNKLFRKVWSAKRFNNASANSQEIESHKALRYMFDVNIDSNEYTFQRNVMRLFSAAHDFDIKHPNNLGTIMIDEVGISLKSSMPYSLPANEKAEKQAKIDLVLEMASNFIGMRKATERMGIPYNEMIKGFWDEADKNEIEEFKKESVNSNLTEKQEAFVFHMIRKSIEQDRAKG